MDKDRLWAALSLVSLLLLGALGAAVLCREEVRESWNGQAAGAVVVIDPGHGGEDGGAVAPDGTVESGLNLAISLRLEAVFSLCGQDALLLRREDVSLHDAGADTLREKKVSDLHNRVDRVNSLADPRLLSIHQNCFPSAKYHGSQVFYAGNPASQPWAARTQENLRLQLDPDNQRSASPVSQEVYLMNHVTCPALLVECGFLSHPQERERLKDGEYQTALAVVIAASYLQGEREGR